MCFYLCNSSKLSPSLVSFRFPLSKPQLAAKWVQSLGMKNFVPTANTCLCSEHFRPECFRDYNGKQFLREDAVPTILSHETTKVGFHTMYTSIFVSRLNHIILSRYDIDEPINIAQIELRKRGVVPKEPNTVNKTVTQAEQDRAKEAGFVRREKRSTIRVSFLLLTHHYCKSSFQMIPSGLKGTSF